MINPAFSGLALKLLPLFSTLLSVWVGFGLAGWRDSRRTRKATKSLAKALQAEVFLTVVALREANSRAIEVRSRRAEGEVGLHTNHSHDLTLSLFLANTSRVIDLPSKLCVLLQIFNRALDRQNGLSRLMDRKYEELSQRNPMRLGDLQAHYDDYISEVERAIEYGELLNQVFAEEFSDSADVYMEETQDPGVINIQVSRKK